MPSIVLGIGIGGTMDQAAVMSKKALLRDISVPHKDADYAKLEEEIMEMVRQNWYWTTIGWHYNLYRCKHRMGCNSHRRSSCCSYYHVPCCSSCSRSTLIDRR